VLTRPAAPSDVPALVELYCAYELALRGAPDTDASDVEGDFASPGLDLARDTLVVEDGGRLVGYAIGYGDGECDSVADPALPTAEVAERLLDWLEARPEHLEHYLPDTDTTRAALFTARGWAPQRTFWRMWRDLDGALPAPAWPAGVSVRDFDRERDAELAHRTITTAFGEIGGQHERTFAEWSAFLLDTPRYDASLYLVAESSGGELVGVALGQDVGEYGFVRQLAVPAAHRGRGIAMALLHECFRRHAARGLPATALGVDAGNPTGALALYEKAGMRVKEQFRRWERPRP
jgi:ribosomal protein S18 acetylase RimI-like enzyme